MDEIGGGRGADTVVFVGAEVGDGVAAGGWFWTWFALASFVKLCDRLPGPGEVGGSEAVVAAGAETRLPLKLMVAMVEIQTSPLEKGMISLDNSSRGTPFL